MSVVSVVVIVVWLMVLLWLMMVPSPRNKVLRLPVGLLGTGAVMGFSAGLLGLHGWIADLVILTFIVSGFFVLLARSREIQRLEASRRFASPRPGRTPGAR